ncbi:nuclear transport factor 2 family protein [Aquimarina mytili]|uniref:Nuclear transport factor 2 family protein n=1 Tax=Aquimarina mytili TaxID=874423 RepID=A0A937A150_9FLAO|nr:nuclear transport factor 2 family protein [Aquimarina mytili]MBL0683105.1 nuclear transport factor 2 family protein [Aquimarina mytili]
MTKEEVARNYLLYLEKGEIDKIIDLFAADGIVVSPLYGTKSAKDFYEVLSTGTNTSKLQLDGLFFEKDSNRVSLLFDYHWELKHGEIVDFKVVDIIELTTENKIKKLTILYDTVRSRAALNNLNLK